MTALIAADLDRHIMCATDPLRSSHRYEATYLVDAGAVAGVRAELAARLDTDRHSAGRAGYGVWTVHYDTPQLRFYWERVNNRPLRRTVRLRQYGERFAVDDETTTYVEIDRRVNRVVQRRRVPLAYRLARLLCDGRSMIEHGSAQRPFLEEVLGLVRGLDLRPVTLTGLRREAFNGSDAEPGLRVLLDHRVRGRDRDLWTGEVSADRAMVPTSCSVLTVRSDARIPDWLDELTVRRRLCVGPVSVYCRSVDMFGRASRPPGGCG